MTTWTPAGPGIWVHPYAFGGNPIHTSAVDVGDGRLLVISPGTDFAEASYAALDALGTVTALLAPGAYHNMGLPAWSARYPEAGMYAPANAVAHIAKVHRDLRPVQPLDALRPLLPDDFVLDEVEGATQPDVFLALTRDGSVTWFTNELISHSADYPPGFLKWVFKLMGNHPGLNVNTLALLLIRGKKPVIRAYFERRLAELPPTRLVPCHGDVLEDATLPTRLAEVLARRL